MRERDRIDDAPPKVCEKAVEYPDKFSIERDRNTELVKIDDEYSE
jgi:hypothetical protein